MRNIRGRFFFHTGGSHQFRAAEVRLFEKPNDRLSTRQHGSLVASHVVFGRGNTGDAENSRFYRISPAESRYTRNGRRFRSDVPRVGRLETNDLTVDDIEFLQPA